MASTGLLNMPILASGALADMFVNAEGKKLRPHQVREKQLLSHFTSGVVFIHGPGGSGKTMAMVAIQYKLREYFGKPAIMDIHPKPRFGPYTYMGSKQFIEELSRITDLTGEGGDTSKKKRKDRGILTEDITDKIRNNLGVQFDNASIGWDEGYRYGNRRRPMDNLVIAYGDYLQQWRHYSSTVLVCTPELNQIDRKRWLNQMTVELRCSSNVIVSASGIRGPKDPNEWMVHLEGMTRQAEPLEWDIPILMYAQLYDSWALVGNRTSILEKAEF
jgi:hypothetical protein